MRAHHPRRRFGQHFLHDPEVIERIIEVLAPVPGQCLIEIGPGRGALTIPLLQRAGALHVIEIDRDLAAALSRRCAGLGDLHVYCQNALAFDFDNFENGAGRLRITGNLPYNISTPLIFHLLDSAPRIADMLFMLQEEVVNRICAEPGSRTYGRLTVMVQALCRAEKLFSVGAGAFTPPPRVTSAVVRLVPRTETGIANYRHLAGIVRQAFSQRRKTLRNALKGSLDEQQLNLLGLDPGMRPEQVTVEEFVRMANNVKCET